MKRSLILLCCSALCFGQPAARGPSYNQIISAGNDLLKEGKLKEAYAAAMSAAQADGSRFEAYALAALSLHGQGADTDAKAFVEKALTRAPEDKKPLLKQMAKLISDALDAAAKPAEPPKGDAATRRQIDALQMIMEDADKATLAADRKRFLDELLTKSEPFVKEHPDQTNVWFLRAVAAVETDNAKAGAEAEQKLLALGMGDSSDPKTRRLMAMLERKGLSARARAQTEAQAEALALATWTDPATGLMWSRKDNGSSVDWNEAVNYCKSLKAGPSSGWRLPEIDELATLYDTSASFEVTYEGKKYTNHVKDGIQLASWAWSATKKGSGEAWFFDFYHGFRFSDPLDHRSDGRALCVRRSGE